MFWMLHVSTYSLRFFRFVATCFVPVAWKTDRQLFSNFPYIWSIFGGNYFKFPTKYMKFPIFVGNLKNVPCVTFPLFSDKIKKKKKKIFSGSIHVGVIFHEN